MKELIKNKIEQLKAEKGIEVLFAAESGSRAWGFESPDSDYDVRLIYTFPRTRYIQVETVLEDINLPVDENLIDLSAWELRKAARLVSIKSNASPFEWIQSPIIYGEVEGFREEFSQVIKSYFQPSLMVYHYLGLAKGTYFKFLQGDQIQIKKYFYALRPILCALWILERNEVAPLVFDEVRTILREETVIEAIEALLNEKERADEGHLIAADSTLQNFIVTSLEHITERVKSADKTAVDNTVMNQFLSKWIR